MSDLGSEGCVPVGEVAADRTAQVTRTLLLPYHTERGREGERERVTKARGPGAGTEGPLMSVRDRLMELVNLDI